MFVDVFFFLMPPIIVCVYLCLALVKRATSVNDEAGFSPALNLSIMFSLGCLKTACLASKRKANEQKSSGATICNSGH